MSYKSVAEIYRGSMEFSQHLAEMEEEYIVAEISRRIGVSVDKEEMIKALKYDRQQYDAGYKDGLAEAKNIKAKYDALVKYLVENGVLGEVVCDEILRFKGGEAYCKLNCYWRAPNNAACIDKFVEMLARNEVM